MITDSSDISMLCSVGVPDPPQISSLCDFYDSLVTMYSLCVQLGTFPIFFFLWLLAQGSLRENKLFRMEKSLEHVDKGSMHVLKKKQAHAGKRKEEKMWGGFIFFYS